MSLGSFANVIACENIRDQGVLESLAKEALKEGADIETIYVTLLAIIILEKAYVSEASEAAMIIANAKTYCKKAGVRNPNAILKKFTLPLRV